MDIFERKWKWRGIERIPKLKVWQIWQPEIPGMTIFKNYIFILPKNLDHVNDAS